MLLSGIQSQREFGSFSLMTVDEALQEQDEKQSMDKDSSCFLLVGEKRKTKISILQLLNYKNSNVVKY